MRKGIAEQISYYRAGGDWVMGSGGRVRERRRSTGNLPGFLAGIACRLAWDVCWSWELFPCSAILVCSQGIPVGIGGWDDEFTLNSGYCIK